MRLARRVRSPYKHCQYQNHTPPNYRLELADFLLEKDQRRLCYYLREFYSLALEILYSLNSATL